MKIDLVKINLGDFYKYKFKSYKPCCDDILDNPCIDFTNYNLTEETPDNEPRYCLSNIETSDDEAWCDNYPISFCPHCGKPIEVEVTETIDFSEGYNTLAKKEHDTLERLRNTDSIKEYDKLLVQKKDLDEKINAISELCEYHEEDFK